MFAEGIDAKEHSRPASPPGGATSPSLGQAPAKDLEASPPQERARFGFSIRFILGVR